MSSGRVLFGYDVESANEKVAFSFLQKVLRVHMKAGVPCTLFTTGYCLEKNASVFQMIDESALIDIQSHTYGHHPSRDVHIRTNDQTILLAEGAQIEIVERDCEKMSRLFRKIFDIAYTGIGAPFIYSGGLRAKQKILEVLDRQRVGYIRSDGRHEDGFSPLKRCLLPTGMKMKDFLTFSRYPACSLRLFLTW